VYNVIWPTSFLAPTYRGLEVQNIFLIWISLTNYKGCEINQNKGEVKRRKELIEIKGCDKKKSVIEQRSM